MKKISLFLVTGLLACFMLACNDSTNKRKGMENTHEGMESHRDSIYNDSTISPKTVDTAGTKLDLDRDTIVR